MFKENHASILILRLYLLRFSPSCFKITYEWFSGQNTFYIFVFHVSLLAVSFSLGIFLGRQFFWQTQHVYVSVSLNVYPFFWHSSQTSARLRYFFSLAGNFSSEVNFLHTSTMHTLPFRLPSLHSKHWRLPRSWWCLKCNLWKTSRGLVSPHRVQVYVGPQAYDFSLVCVLSWISSFPSL